MRFGRVLLITGVLAACVFAGPGCRRDAADAGELTVFVAASMRDAVEELAAKYAEQTGTRVAVSAAATGILRKQVESGAECDVFIAADGVEVDILAAKGLIVADSRCVVARNRLVAIACGDDPPVVADLKSLAHADVGRVAFGDPAYVPAGRYAKHALEQSGVWDEVAPRAVLADNVRVACQYVRSGQADVGLVYATDAALMSDCRVLFEIDEALSGPIVCPGVACANSKDVANARRFLEFATANEQSHVWQRNGFR